MELINKIQGAVFFVDILGFGALTQKKINLKNEDFSIWLDQYSLEYENQNLAASILAKFREILLKIDEKFEDVTISQLSDGAFVWSKNIKEVIISANNIMSECISNGVLCRGGLSYGEIIETSQSHNLGRFILGDAVTNAVKLEGIAKGCRIMINQEFPHDLYSCDKEFSKDIFTLFQPFINPLDFETYDEFKWYFVPFMEKDFSIQYINQAQKTKLTNSRLKLANMIRLSPKFSWNATNFQGVVHLKSSLNFLSETMDEIFKISHNFNFKEVYDNRSNSSLFKANELIDEEIN
ncbi:hypothetical protein [Chryseobacterium sp. M5A1_1a]